MSHPSPHLKRLALRELDAERVHAHVREHVAEVVEDHVEDERADLCLSADSIYLTL